MTLSNLVIKWQMKFHTDKVMHTLNKQNKSQFHNKKSSALKWPQQAGDLGAVQLLHTSFGAAQHGPEGQEHFTSVGAGQLHEQRSLLCHREHAWFTCIPATAHGSGHCRHPRHRNGEQQQQRHGLAGVGTVATRDG